MNLYDRYAAFVAKRPDLAVPDLVFERFFWTHPDWQGGIRNAAVENIIGWHLLGKLPMGAYVGKPVQLHFAPSADSWVVERTARSSCGAEAPLEALFRFFEENPDAGK